MPGQANPPEQWKLRQQYGPRTWILAIVVLLFLVVSGSRTGIGEMVGMLGEWVAAGVGLREDSAVGRGLNRFLESALPPVISEATPIARIEGFDPDELPIFSYVETREVKTSTFDHEQGCLVERVERAEFLVEPIGYLLFVCSKMLESLEMAVWGTIFALLIGIPLACLGARNFTPHRVVYSLSRATSSFLRAVPELVGALILVLAFGFGPIAGVAALGLHTAGFFGKFFAEDIENSDVGPQEALRSIGAGRLEVLRFAVLPQVLPQYVAYTQYILERNVRMATVIGVVGAGGIGIELKGRFDMFQFGHVTTILLVIFTTVLLLEQITQRIRRRLI